MKNCFSGNLINIKEMFRYEALQVVCSFIMCQSLTRKHPRFPCLLLRDALYEKSYQYASYAFRNKLYLVSTATITSAANGFSSIAVDIVSFHNSPKLIVHCFPTEGTWEKTYHFYSFLF